MKSAVDILDTPLPISRLAEAETLYSATSLAIVDPEALRSWSPKASLWGRIKPLIAKQAGAVLRWSEVDGHSLHYWDCGAADKPVLVLLHGFGSSKENWSFLVPLLTKTYRVLVPDLPGFGNSSYRSNCDYRVDTQAERVAEWLSQLGVSQFRLAGSSMGGGISAMIAARYPERVVGLCLMNAAGAPATRMSMLEAGILAEKNYLIAENRGEALRLFQVCFHSNKHLLGAVFALLMAGDMRHRGILNHAIFGDLVRSLEGTYLSLPSITAPTLVLWGDSDQVLSVTCVDAFLAQIPQAKAMVLPETGHLPMIEKPRDTAIVLQAFMNAGAQQ
ncbi:MAG: abhydrolase domain-containing protein 6 [Bermanella sp.]